MRVRAGVATALAALMVLTGLTPVAALDGLTGVAGQVVREDGSAVPGATVTATPDSADGEPTTTTTDDSGHYTLDTEGGGHVLRVTPSETTTDLAPRQVAIAIEDGRRTIRDVVLRSANLTGVVRGPDGAPVAGARVKVWQHEFSTTEMVAESAPDGTFEMAVGVGSLSIWAQPPPTLAPHTYAGSVEQNTSVPPEGVLDGVVLQLRPVAVTGRVLSPDGVTPVVGARLEIDTMQPNGSSSSDDPETGADGTFAAALASTGTVNIVARPPLSNPGGWGQVTLTVQHDGPGTTDAGDLQLSDAHNVSGRVTRNSGEGVAGADLTFAGWDAGGEFVHVTTQADATGAYRVALPPSEAQHGYSVSASAPGDTNELLDASGPRFFVGADAVTRPDIVLVTPNLRGSAREPVTGGPLRGIRVSVLDADGDDAGSSTTDARGLFGVVVPPGEYELVAELPNDREDHWIRKTSPATVVDGVVTSVDVSFRVAPPAPYALDGSALPLPELPGLVRLGHGDLAPALSPDGRYAVYEARYQDENAPPPDCSSGEGCIYPPETRPLFRVDLATGDVVRTDLSSTGAPSDDVRAAAVSSSGEVAFISSTDGLVDGEDDGSADVFLRDPEQGTTVLISDEPVRYRSDVTWQTDVDSTVSISADGSRLTWAEPSFAMGPNEYEMQTGKAVVADLATAARREFPERLAAFPVLSADGSTLAYTSHMGGYQWDPVPPGHVDDLDGNHRTQLEVVDLTAADNDPDAVFEVYSGWDSPWMDLNTDLPDYSYPSLTDDGDTLAYGSYADPCETCSGGYVHTANIVDWRSPETTARQIDPFASEYTSSSGPERIAITGNGTHLAVLGSVTDYDEGAESSTMLWRYDLSGGEIALVSQDAAGTFGGRDRRVELHVSPRPFTADAGLVAFGATGDNDTGYGTTAYLGRVPETDPPTWDEAAALTAGDVGTASLRLSWTAATDTTGVAGYRVYRDGGRIADVPATQRSAVVSGLAPGTTYEFAVQAYDHAGNASADGPRTTATTLESTTTELLPLSAQVSGSAVALAWDPAPPSAEGLVVRRAVNGGPQSDNATLGRDAVSYRDASAPADASVAYQVWTTDSAGTATPFTTVASVTTPALALSAADWSAPTAAPGVLRLHGDLTVTLRGSPGRSASAVVAYTGWYSGGTLLDAPAAADAVIPLAEDAASPGVYRGTFPLAEGIASITGITTRLSDGNDSEITRELPRLPVAVSGAVRAAPASADPLDGTRLSLVSASTGFGAQQQLTGSDPVTFGAAPAGTDYVVEARGDNNWFAGRVADIVVQSGRTSQVPLDVVLPGSITVTLTVPGGGIPPGFVVHVVDRDSGSILRAGTTHRGSARLGPLPSGTALIVRLVPPVDTDYLPLSRELVLQRGENVLAFEAAEPATGAVTGVVRAEGAPVDGARVALVHYVDGRSRTTYATTGEDGSYTVTGYVGEASVSAEHLGVDVPAVPITIPAGGSVAQDLTVPQPTPREVVVELRTRHSVDDEWALVTVDWRTAHHFGGMVPSFSGAGRSYAWQFDEETGRNLLLVDARDGEVIRLCANAREVGLGSACGRLVLGPEPNPLLRVDIGPAPVVRARVVDAAGEPVDGSYLVSRVDGDTRTRVRGGWASAGVVQLETPSVDGEHIFTMTTEQGRVARSFALSGTDVDLGQLVLRPTTTFTSDLNVLRSLDPVARPGQLLTLEATVRNDTAAVVDAVSARLELPTGVLLESEGVLVDGAAVPDASRAVPLGTFQPGQVRRLRFSARVAADYESATVPVAVVLLASPAVEDHLPDVVVPVEQVTINPMPVLGAPTFPIGGSAPPGAEVTVRDGATLVGTAVAGVGGRWRSRVTVPNDGYPSRHAMTATAVWGDEVLVADEVVLVDTTRPVPQSATMAQGSGRDRRSHTFDPRDGPAEFVFTWVPHQQVELTASFGAASRVSEAAFYIGDQRIPAAVASDGSVSATAQIDSPGDIYVETEVGSPPAVGMPARPSNEMSTAAARLPSSFSGFGVQVLRETEQEVDLEFTLPALGGATASASIRARQISNYQPTAADEAAVNRTGRHVYGASITNTGNSVSLRVVLPESEVNRLGGSLPSSGSGSGSGSLRSGGNFTTARGAALALAPKGVELVFTVSTGGWDAFSAAGAGGKYGELHKLLDQLEAMNCNDEFNARWRAEIDNLANWMIAADAGAAVLAVAGAVAGAFTAGAGALAVWAAGLVIGMIIDDLIADKVDEMKRNMAQESDDCLRPKRKQVARPTWIIDPSGYVFEGLRTRRLADVTATLLSAPSENGPWSLAEMEQYGQQNPVVSDGQGRYGWNVPQGWWKVQYTKDGYETAFSRPLKVLPPHLDVDEAMVRLEAPAVASAQATAERSFRLSFSHLMRVSSVGPAVLLRDAAGQLVPATVTAVDPAPDDDGVLLADAFLVVPTEAASDGSYSVEVPAEVQNYAGRLMSAATLTSVALTTPDDVVEPTPSASAGPIGSSPPPPGTAPVPPADPPSPTASQSGNPPPGGSVSPTPTPSDMVTAGPDCATAPTVRLVPFTIIATGASQVTVRGAPGTAVELFAYTRPSTTYRVVRTATLDAAGLATFRVVPPANTRLYAQQRGCAPGPSVVLKVRTALTITAVRTGRLSYRFAGDSLPARVAEGLVVSLYRVTVDGRHVLTAQTRASAVDGEWSMSRRFLRAGRFGFVVRTDEDLRNAPGSSSVRPTVVH